MPVWLSNVSQIHNLFSITSLWPFQATSALTVYLLLPWPLYNPFRHTVISYSDVFPLYFQSPFHTRALPMESIVGPSPPCWPCYRSAHLLSRPLFPQTTSVLLQDFCKCYSPRMLFLFAQPAPSLPVISGRSSLLPYLNQIPLSEYWGVGCSGSKVDRYLG